MNCHFILHQKNKVTKQKLKKYTIRDWFKCLYPLIHIKNKLGKQIQNQSFNKLEMIYVQKWTTFVNFPFTK
jgi:hypothetical protein